MNEQISIHVLNYNGKHFLKGCIDSLLKQDYPNFEILLVDNGSTDGSIDFIKENYGNEISNKKVRILSLDKNYGVTGAWNRSYKESEADFVVLSNNDVIFLQDNFLSLLVEYMIKESASISMGWIYPLNLSKEDKLARIENLKYATLNILGTCTDNVLKENIQLLSGGCCMMLYKEKIKSPLFPEEYFMSSEDVFLGWKSFLQGNKIVICKEAGLYHYDSGTVKKRSYLIRYNTEKNRLANLIILFDNKTLIKIFPLYIFENMVKSVYLITEPRIFKALFKAIVWDIKNIRVILSYRNKIKETRKVEDKTVISKMSYRIFPETPEIFEIAHFLNKMVKFYCIIMGLKVYELNNIKEENEKSSIN